MKILTIVAISILMLSGCTSVQYQKMQAERDQLRKNYEVLRDEHSELKVKEGITDPLLGRWKFLNLEVAESAATENVKETKAALRSHYLKGLTLDFFEEKGSHYYRGKKGNTEIFGQFRIFTIRYGDEPFPFIRFLRRSGPEISEFLFAARASSSGLADPQGLATAKEIGISVTEDRLYLTMPGKMQLGPTGWVKNGDVHCYFRRVEE